MPLRYDLTSALPIASPTVSSRHKPLSSCSHGPAPAPSSAHSRLEPQYTYYLPRDNISLPYHTHKPPRILSCVCTYEGADDGNAPRLSTAAPLLASNDAWCAVSLLPAKVSAAAPARSVNDQGVCSFGGLGFKTIVAAFLGRDNIIFSVR